MLRQPFDPRILEALIDTNVLNINANALDILNNEGALDDLADELLAQQIALGNKAEQNGTYSGLRAQATTKADVGLGNVPNYGASSSTSSTSATTFATSKAVRDAMVEANKALEIKTLWSGWTASAGLRNLSEDYRNFRFLGVHAGETQWGGYAHIETEFLTESLFTSTRSDKKAVLSIGANGYVDIIGNNSSYTALYFGNSLAGWVSKIVGIGRL